MTDGAAVLRGRAVTKTYGSGENAVHAVSEASIELHAGELVMLRGRRSSFPRSNEDKNAIRAPRRLLFRVQLSDLSAAPGRGTVAFDPDTPLIFSGEGETGCSRPKPSSLGMVGSLSSA